jgi:hypothetical protein
VRGTLGRVSVVAEAGLVVGVLPSVPASASGDFIADGDGKAVFRAALVDGDDFDDGARLVRRYDMGRYDVALSTR